MKRSILFWGFSFCVFFFMSGATAPQRSRDIELQVEKSDGPVINAIGLIPFAASIEDETVSVFFLKNENATVRIINTTTGEVVRECVYSATILSTLPISLEGEECGEYKLDICSGNTTYFGIFVLC
ncbi:DUF3244 domain-containing protein [uncultured Bacteroides sp.]|uniref:DUF3244 domain-containing protein n=1 Tax=uncultured Bacteroides sp. TaxID=162156 RepID=UPI002AAB6FF8|nr:DUF3244 domain-containing protein [uncultured Bacteroides sp.]